MLLTKQILMGMGWREEQITVVDAAFPPTDKWSCLRSCPTSDWVLRAREEAEADKQGQRQRRSRR